MRVNCSKVIPVPMAESRISHDGIWGGEFCLGDGESVLVTSPSARGKTTFLHLLYGIRRDYTGTVSLDGTDIHTLSEEAWLRLRQRHLSLVFQDLRLFDAVTVRDTIEMVRVITGTVSSGKVREMAGAMGIVDQFDTPCGILSSGQRQRAAILRALARPFSLLLLDEPFSHLDDRNASIAAEVIAGVLKENGASVVVTGLGEYCPLPVERVCVL
jgi:ABC-type lipoprotein export system ATPase subunit